jgi:hypothetical protein
MYTIAKLLSAVFAGFYYSFCLHETCAQLHNICAITCDYR